MAERWIAVAVALLTLAIVGIFVFAVLRSPPMAVSGGNVQVEETGPGATRFTSRTGSWRVIVDLSLAPAGVLAVAVSITDADGRPAAQTIQPMAALSMADMAMGTEPIALVQEAAGRWRGAGRVSMAGRWNLQLDIEGADLSLPFEHVSR